MARLAPRPAPRDPSPARLSVPLKVLGKSTFGFHPDDRDRILGGTCPLCREGIVQAIAGEWFCTFCLTAFVEQDLNPAESARRERRRFANAHRK